MSEPHPIQFLQVTVTPWMTDKADAKVEDYDFRVKVEVDSHVEESRFVLSRDHFKSIFARCMEMAQREIEEEMKKRD